MSETIGNKVYIFYGEAWHAAHKIQKIQRPAKKIGMKGGAARAAPTALL